MSVYMDCDLVVHLGLPKTATTFLQYRLFNRQSEMPYLHYSGAPVEESLLNYIRAGRFRRKLLKGFVDALPVGQLLISNENLTMSTGETLALTGHDPAVVGERLSLLKESLCRLRVIIGVREQSSWLASMYAQSSKRRPELSQQGFEASLDRICDEPSLGSVGWLEYDRSVRILHEALGPENVCVVPFESLNRDPVAQIERLERFLAIPGLVDIYQAHDPDILRINVSKKADGRWEMFGGQPDLYLTEDMTARIRARFHYGWE